MPVSVACWASTILWFSTAASAVNTYSGMGKEDAMKVVYTSPNFNGLSIGMSYAPNKREETSTTGRRPGWESTAVGATYSTDFWKAAP